MLRGGVRPVEEVEAGDGFGEVGEAVDFGEGGEVGFGGWGEGEWHCGRILFEDWGGLRL